MQNKKSLLQRLLVIYITFFIVLAVSIAHSILPEFSRNFNKGAKMGQDIASKWQSGTPRMIYMLGDVEVSGQREFEIEGLPEGITAQGSVRNINLIVEQDSEGISAMGLAFRSIGGNVWLYVLVMLGSLSYIAIIVLMFLIIHSIRRSIREETPLAKRNVWCLRVIGMLTILTELCRDMVDWSLSTRAAELLASSGYSVDTIFHVSYANIIMGILILFAAEVFAIGQNLSEEQKLTI